MTKLGLSELEFAAKKKRTRRGRFLKQIGVGMPLALLMEQIGPG